MTPRLWQTTATDVEDWTQKLRVHVSASCIALTQYTRIQKIKNSQVNYLTFHHHHHHHHSLRISTCTSLGKLYSYRIQSSTARWRTTPTTAISILLQFFCRWLLNEPVVCGGGSEKSRFSSSDVRSDVLSPFHVHVTAFSTVQQSTEENTLRFASFPSLLFKSK